MAYQVKKAHTLSEAWQLLSENPDAYLMAGGTDIIPRLNQKIERHPMMICLEDIDALKGVDDTAADALRIGALTKLIEINEDPRLSIYQALNYAASRVASPQIRNHATIGGNVLQENRCIYFNQSVSWRRVDCCFKLGGNRCYQYKGSPGCVALFQSDTAPVLMAHDAKAVFESPQGVRTLPLAELYLNAGKKAKERNEILTSILVPKAKGTLHSAYARETIRGSFDFPIVSCAVVIETEGDVIKKASMVMGSAGVKPQPIGEAGELLVNKHLSDIPALLPELKAAGRKKVAPFRDTRVDAAVRKAMGEAVIEKAFMQIAYEK